MNDTDRPTTVIEHDKERERIVVELDAARAERARRATAERFGVGHEHR